MQRTDNLKSLTYNEHREAEKQRFVKELLKGNVPERVYAIYLYNQFLSYKTLEIYVKGLNIFEDFSSIERSYKIMEDFYELWKEESLPTIHESTKEYISYISKNYQNSEVLLAHVYVRHMGDLNGGQYISKRIPGKGRMYSFVDVEKCKNMIIEKLHDGLADEAKTCFVFATKLFQNLEIELK